MLDLWNQDSYLNRNLLLGCLPLKRPFALLLLGGKATSALYRASLGRRGRQALMARRGGVERPHT